MENFHLGNKCDPTEYDSQLSQHVLIVTAEILFAFLGQMFVV
jgi:hypothetical protein